MGQKKVTKKESRKRKHMRVTLEPKKEIIAKHESEIQLCEFARQFGHQHQSLVPYWLGRRP